MRGAVPAAPMPAATPAVSFPPVAPTVPVGGATMSGGSAGSNAGYNVSAGATMSAGGGNAYPPAPTMAAQQPQTYGSAALDLSHDEAAVSAPSAARQPATEFRAPQRMAAPADQGGESFIQKSRSLFDRFKGGRGDEVAPETSFSQAEAPVQQQSQAEVRQQPVAPQPQQAQLDIETPQQPQRSTGEGEGASGGDNLDIPAFLRRQAS